MTADLATSAMDPNDGTCLYHPEIHLCRPGPGGEWRRLLRDCPLCRVSRGSPAGGRGKGGLGDSSRSNMDRHGGDKAGGSGRRFRRSSDRNRAMPGLPYAPLEPPASHAPADAEASPDGSLGRGLRQLSLSGQCSITTDRTDTTVASSLSGCSSANHPQHHNLGGNYDRRGPGGHGRNGYVPSTPGVASPHALAAVTPGAETMSPTSPLDDYATPGGYTPGGHTPGGYTPRSCRNPAHGGDAPSSHHSHNSQRSVATQRSHASQHSHHSQQSHHSRGSQSTQSSQGSRARGRRTSTCGEVVCGLRHIDPSNGLAGSYTGQVDPATGLPNGIGTLR